MNDITTYFISSLNELIGLVNDEMKKGDLIPDYLNIEKKEDAAVNTEDLLISLIQSFSHLNNLPLNNLYFELKPEEREGYVLFAYDPIYCLNIAIKIATNEIVALEDESSYVSFFIASDGEAYLKAWLVLIHLEIKRKKISPQRLSDSDRQDTFYRIQQLLEGKYLPYYKLILAMD